MTLALAFKTLNIIIPSNGSVTPRPERVYGTCNRRVAYVHQGLPQLIECHSSIFERCF